MTKDGDVVSKVPKRCWQRHARTGVVPLEASQPTIGVQDSHRSTAFARMTEPRQVSPALRH